MEALFAASTTPVVTVLPVVLLVVFVALVSHASTALAIVAHGCLEVLGGGRSLRSESVLLQLVHGHGCVGHVFLELLLEVFLKQLVGAIFLVGIMAVKPS